MSSSLLEMFAKRLRMRYCCLEHEVSGSSGKRVDHVLVHESGSIVVIVEHSGAPKKEDLDQIEQTLRELRRRDSIYRRKLVESTGVELRPDFIDIAYLHKEGRPDPVAQGLAASFGIRIANCFDDLLRKLAEDLSKKFRCECIRTLRRRSFCDHALQILWAICNELGVERACEELERLQRKLQE